MTYSCVVSCQFLYMNLTREPGLTTVRASGVRPMDDLLWCGRTTRKGEPLQLSDESFRDAEVEACWPQTKLKLVLIPGAQERASEFDDAHFVVGVDIAGPNVVDRPTLQRQESL